MLNTGTRRLAPLLLVALTAVAACSGGSDDASPTVADGSEFVDEDETAGAPFDLVIDDETIIATEDGEIPPTTTEAPLEGPDVPPADPLVTVAPIPLPPANEVDRIISLAPTHTETLFALGLGQFLVGVDPNSDYPAEAIELQREGLDDSSSFIDPILALEPDVVVLGEDFTGLAARLNEAGVATYTGPPARSLDEIYAQIRAIADIVARPDLGEDLVSGMQQEVDAIRASLPDTGGRELTYFHEIDPSYYTFGSESWITGLYAELGIVNITDATSSGIQLFEPDVIAADPDVIILGDVDCCGVTIDSVGNRPGWSSLSAVRNGAVVELSDPLYSRWGPRVVEMLRLVAGGVAAAS